MTGPEHYREAERLLNESSIAGRGEVFPAVEDGDVNTCGNALAAAQVHATLALAAATAWPAILAYCGDEATEPAEWTKAAS